MSTFSDIMSDAFARLGVYAPGETISAADSAQALATFNDMLDSLSNQNLACFANYDQSFALQVGVNSYTIGASGTINQARPLQILTNPGSARIIDPTGNVYPVQVIDQFAWQQIPIQSTTLATSTYPDTLFYDPQFPNGVINVYPTPSSTYTLHFTSRLALVDAATLTSTISLPPGYLLMLKANLAENLLEYWPQDQLLTARIMKRAKETLATVKRMNTKVPAVNFDSALMNKAMKSYNIYIDR